MKYFGYGWNGVKVFMNVEYVFYVLVGGLLGVMCEVCGFGKMYCYCEKIIICIVGQFLFGV